ncbi:MAG: hypothetical protein H6539_08590 [Bacteroidales bacterium]|nr:hypothetical protein [Bacteroidales bacterium]
MRKNIALFFSILFHPVLMPIAGMAILLFTGSYVSLIPIAARKMIMLLFASGTLLLPLIMIPVIRLRSDRDFMIQKQIERTLPLAMTFVFYLLTYTLFLKVPVYGFMHDYMLGIVVSVLLALIANLRFKISLHMIGMGGLTAFLLIIALERKIFLFYWLMAAILASGIVGTSRLYLKTHTPAEIYFGFFLGGLAMCLGMLLSFS